MAELRLLVNGRKYAGWKSVRVIQSIEALAGSFTLDISDRWADQSEPWPILEEDACRVEMAGRIVIDGFVGRRGLSLSAERRTLLIAGKDRAATLVECSAVLDRWSFRNATALDIARKVAEPFGISVTLAPGLTLATPIRKLAVHQGESAFDVIDRAARAAGVLAVSDGAGGVLLTRAGVRRAAPIVEGVNLLSGSVDYSGENRYRQYVLATQVAGTDLASGKATRIRVAAVDENVRREERVLLIRPPTGVNAERAKRWADWEARVRAARSETVMVTVQGWQQPDGDLWPVNALVAVESPGLGVSGDLLISQADYSLSEMGETTQLQLVRPDAFTPDPTAVVKRTGKGSAWKTGATPGLRDLFSGGT